ncbi:TetR family transcriptional regulator C-terminal domain-containing protein [Aestuariivita boseongensis]|uniref:TetR family transcriptional regulator C-terminal domain-containing protein n=1 Tax=Aestuariivita boseongensis TaxID=1470562 RepID=UPI0006820C91|nr:TetR family transcriptional regulator C-terminal domain-containing protein [Aestuariivita boseongensis]
MSEAQLKRPRKERKENAERRRRQLLDAARRSILTHGLAKTTLATVADEAGLSQGVAVFYFKSKAGLLTETLRDLYSGYEALWTSALEGAGDDPVDQLRALLDADFEPAACGPDVLPLWFAFWGELHFTQTYDEVADSFDTRRSEALSAVWRSVLRDASEEEAAQMAEWMDTLTDGYWQRLHLAPGSFDRRDARRAAQECIARLVPQLGRIAE